LTVTFFYDSFLPLTVFYRFEDTETYLNLSLFGYFKMSGCKTVYPQAGTGCCYQSLRLAGMMNVGKEQNFQADKYLKILMDLKIESPVPKNAGSDRIRTQRNEDKKT